MNFLRLGRIKQKNACWNGLHEDQDKGKDGKEGKFIFVNKRS